MAQRIVERPPGAMKLSWGIRLVGDHAFWSCIVAQLTVKKRRNAIKVQSEGQTWCHHTHNTRTHRGDVAPVL